jgi:hypothetical protein
MLSTPKGMMFTMYFDCNTKNDGATIDKAIEWQVSKLMHVYGIQA